MIYLKYALSFILYCSGLYSQLNVNLQKIIEIPVEISEYELRPTHFSVSATGFYLLDSANRQIAFLSNVGELNFAGGYGIDYDAFIDPIDILSSKLQVWIVDRTENRLIEFDHKLNYLQTIEFDQIYPEFSGIDNYGNILLQSEQEQMIIKANPLSENFKNFIDLSIWNNAYECISDVHIASDGKVGILSYCNNSIHLFNRLGKLENKFQTNISDGSFLIKLSKNWFIINSAGQITSILSNKKVDLPIEQIILDVAQMDGILYILFSDKIWVVDVSME